MTPPSARSHLANSILTATPQRRHLLLIEGALRHARRGRELLDGGQTLNARGELLRAQTIVCEMACSLDLETGPAVARNLALLYRYLIEQLAEAILADSTAVVDGCLTLLEHERETWAELCRRSAAAPAPHFSASPAGSLALEA